MADDASAFSRGKIVFVIARIIANDRVLLAGDRFIAADADIALFMAANEVVIGMDAVIAPFFGSVGGDKPAHYGVYAQFFLDDHLRAPIILGGSARRHSARARTVDFRIVLRRHGHPWIQRTGGVVELAVAIGALRMDGGIVKVACFLALFHRHGSFLLSMIFFMPARGWPVYDPVEKLRVSYLFVRALPAPSRSVQKQRSAAAAL